MSSSGKNLSDFSHTEIPSAEGLSFAIIAAEWNHEITKALTEGAITLLKKYGAREADIKLELVPGSFELIQGANLAVRYSKVDAVICIGCVIKGDTPHFEYICEGVTQGIALLNTYADVPVVYGVLTVLDEQQALERTGGKHGNKGEEAAVTAIKMAHLRKAFRGENTKKGIGFSQ